MNNATIIKNTVKIKNVRRENRQFDGKTQTVVVNEGPRVDDVEKATGHKLTAVSVREVDRQTFVSVPEKLKHPTSEPAPNEKPLIIQGQPNPMPAKNPEMPNNIPPKKELPAEKAIPPDKIIRQSPLDRIVPSAKKELPLDKMQPHPKESVPPSQSPPHPPAPVMPSGNPGPNEKGQDKDKDQGHDIL